MEATRLSDIVYNVVISIHERLENRRNRQGTHSSVAKTGNGIRISWKTDQQSVDQDKH